MFVVDKMFMLWKNKINKVFVLAGFESEFLFIFSLSGLNGWYQSLGT